MRRHVRWPGGKTICATFTVALEAYTKAGHFKTLDIQGPNLFSISHADYGGNAGIWRIMEILERHGARATIDINGLAVEKWPDRQEPCMLPAMNSPVMAIRTKSR